jgi:methyltransferase (TIGR00027 family)
MARHAAIQSAETMAFLRAVVAGEKDLAVRSEDRLAKHFLGRKYRLLVTVGVQALLKRILEFAVPGSYGFTIARTRHFDEVLLSESRAGIEQLVLLGAGYDTRPFRLRDALRNIRVFEIDHPGTQARKRRMLAQIDESSPANVSYIPVDFNQQSLQQALASHGFSSDRKTLFLWEGVSYYLPRPVVEGVLDLVGGCAAGSSIVFDYATTAFVNGDTSTYGGRQVARWLKKIREPFLFGLDAGETPEFLGARALSTVSDLGPEDLAKAYLKAKDGRSIGMTFGHVRMVHARVTGARNPAASPVGRENVGPKYDAAAQKNSIRELNDALRQTFTGGRVLLSPGVLSLPAEANADVLERVRSFTAFDPENEADHDFGRFDFAGVAYCFELECPSRARDGSKEAVDASKATRTLIIMRADEY